MDRPVESSIRLDLAASLDHPGETTYSLCDLSEAMVQQLAAGTVPKVLQAMAEDLLSFLDADLEAQAKASEAVIARKAQRAQIAATTKKRKRTAA